MFFSHDHFQCFRDPGVPAHSHCLFAFSVDCNFVSKTHFAKSPNYQGALMWITVDSGYQSCRCESPVSQTPHWACSPANPVLISQTPFCWRNGVPFHNFYKLCFWRVVDFAKKKNYKGRIWNRVWLSAKPFPWVRFKLKVVLILLMPIAWEW